MKYTSFSSLSLSLSFSQERRNSGLFVYRASAIPPFLFSFLLPSRFSLCAFPALSFHLLSAILSLSVRGHVHIRDEHEFRAGSRFLTGAPGERSTLPGQRETRVKGMTIREPESEREGEKETERRE